MFVNDILFLFVMMIVIGFLFFIIVSGGTAPTNDWIDFGAKEQSDANKKMTIAEFAAKVEAYSSETSDADALEAELNAVLNDSLCRAVIKKYCH